MKRRVRFAARSELPIVTAGRSIIESDGLDGLTMQPIARTETLKTAARTGDVLRDLRPTGRVFVGIR